MNATQANEWLREQSLLYGVPLRPDGRIGQAMVVALLDRCDYVVGPGTFSEFERKGYFQPPGNGIWTAEQVVRLVRTLNYLRRWKPGSNQFDKVKPLIRRMIESGDDSALKDLEGSTIEVLLVQIAEADDRNTREMLREAIIRRMNEVGFVEE
jgi:hypothetical protein